jgi:hypothetical protein
VYWVALAAFYAGQGLLAGWIAMRKGRSFGWWWVAGTLAGLAAIALALVVPRGGEPFRFSALRALAVFAALVGGTLVLLAVVAELFG